MPIKRDSIFNNLILACESYAEVPNVINPGNYYGQIREIRRLANAAEPNDATTLKTLTDEVLRLRSYLSPDQIAAFDKHYEDVQKEKIGGQD